MVDGAARLKLCRSSSGRNEQNPEPTLLLMPDRSQQPSVPNAILSILSILLLNK